MSLSLKNTKPESVSPEILKPTVQNTEKVVPSSSEPCKLAPSLWLRAMTDFDAPFGRDGLPTVWG